MRLPTSVAAAGLAIALLTGVGLVACEPPPPTTCHGLSPTISASGPTINGTSGDDVIIGTNAAETINGKGGNDTICAAGGDDTISGGAGNDYVDGGNGADKVTYASIAGPVNVNLASGQATGEGTDTLLAIEGAIGTPAGDTFTGGSGGESFSGGAGGDTFNTGGGFDSCSFGTGVDHATGCEAISGNVATTSEQDTVDLALTSGRRYYFDGPSTCTDIRWSGTNSSGASWSSTQLCNDQERVAPASGNVHIVIGGQGGTQSGNYAITAYQPTDVTGTISVNGSAVTATTTTPGQSALFTFSGTNGQKVSTALTGATFAHGYVVEFHRPDGSELTGYGFGTGDGFANPVTLDVTGTWTVVVNPYDDSTGHTQVKLYNVIDQTGTITVNGSAVTATTTTPGQSALFTFSGTNGQKVSTALTGATFAHGYVVEFHRPDGSELTGYGFGTGDGFANPVTLDVTGTWTVVVNPYDDSTGHTQVKLYNVIDQTGTITFGPSVHVATTTPGQVARFTFTGTNGQKVSAKLTSATFSSGEVIALYRPDGSQLTGVGGSATATLSSTTLDASGQWSIVVDPYDNWTGTATLDLNTP